MRRRSALLVSAVVVLLGFQLGVLPAFAQKVANPSGVNFKLTVHTATLQIRDNVFDFSDARQPQCNDGANNDEDLLGGAPQDNAIDFSGGDPQCTSALDDSEVQGGFQAMIPVSITGTVSANGTWVVAPSGVVVPQVWLFARAPVLGAFIITVSTSSLFTETGSLDPLSGTSFNRLRLRIDLDGSNLGSNCHIGDSGNPIDVNVLSTANSPGGVPYNADTGTMSMANHTFAVPGASGCSTFPINVNDEINNSLGLPSPSGQNHGIFSGDFPANAKPLRAITANLTVTPGVACRPTSFSAAGSTSTQPVTSYGFDDTNNGGFEQTGLTTTRSVTFPTAGTRTARLRVTDVQADFHEALRTYTVGTNLAPSSSFTPNPVPRVAHNGSQAITLAGSDPEGGTLGFSIPTPPAHGTVTGTPPNVTYTPASGYNGLDSLVFRVSDDCNNNVDRTVPLYVNGLPIATDQSVTTDQTIPVNITLAGTDPDGDPLGFGVASFPANGTLSGTAPNLTYTPDAPFSGSDSFTFTVDDGFGGTDTGTVDITVVPNIFPVADDQNLVTVEDTPLGVTLTGTDGDGDPTIFSIVTGPANGSLSGTAPNLTFTPAGNFHGNDSFTFKIADDRGGSDTGTVSIVVTPVNDAPSAVDQNVTATENTATAITLSATDPDGDTLTFGVATPPTNGTLGGTAPNLTYTPNSGYNGPDSFTFSVSDGNGGTDSGTITIAVVPVNDPPTATDQFVDTQEDTPLSVTLSGTDPEGVPLTFSVTGGPANGTLTGTAPNLTYTPGPNFNGFDSFTFEAGDGVNTDSGTIDIAVLAVNDAPVAQAQSVNAAEDAATPITLSATDVDDSASSLTYQVLTPPIHGSLSGSGANLTYTPAANYNGPDSFVFRARDPQALSTTATVSISVSPVNDAPKATGATKSTQEDTAVGVLLAGTDIDGDALTFSVLSGPANGTLTGAAPNLTYTPAANYNGIDTFTFEAKDGDGATGTATFSIAVLAVNDAPVAASQSVSVTEDTPTPITVSGTDADGDSLTYRVEVGPTKGTLSGTAPNLTYTPAANYNGPDSFVFSVRDPGGRTTSATVSITVVAAPIIATSMTADPVVAQLSGLKWYYPRLTAHLNRADTNGPLAGKSVSFTVQNAVVCTAITDATGTASCGGTSNQALLAQSYTANFAGDFDFGASSATGTVTR